MTQVPKLLLKTLVKDPDMIVAHGYTPDVSGVPVVVFASAAKETRNGNRMEYVQAMAQLGRPIYWIAEPNSAWYATKGFVDRVTDLILGEMRRFGADRVDTIGSSMGGFGALAFAERLPVRTALSFGTRFTPDTRDVPDRRIAEHLHPYLDLFPFPTIEKGLAAAERAILVHGDMGPDQPHVLRIQPPATAEHWIMPDCGHLVGAKLHELKLLRALVCSAMTQDWEGVHKTLESAHARPIAERRADIEARLGKRLKTEAKQASPLRRMMTTLKDKMRA